MPVVNPENRVAGTGEVISQSNCAHQAPGHLSCLDLGRAQNAGPTESAPLWSTRVPEPERLRPGKCIQPRAGLSSQQSNLEPKQYRQGKHTRREWGQTQCGRVTASTRQYYLFAAFFPGGSEGKVSAYNVGDLGSIPGSGRSPGEGNDNRLQYSYLENPMD